MKIFVKLVRWVVGIAVGVAVVVFAVATREPVTITLDPLPLSFAPRLVWVAFAALVVGFAAGAAVAWFGGGKWRRLARARKHRVAVLERELARRDTDVEAARQAPAELPPAA